MRDIPEGKFCDLCSKKVYDLTKLSHSEISDITERNHGEKFCGILVNKKPEQKGKRSFQFLKIFPTEKILLQKLQQELL
jgi:hypothetical protein